MNSRMLAASLVVLSVSLAGAAETQDVSPTPQPRPRLYNYAALPPSSVADADGQSEAGVVTMERMEVTESKGPAIPKQIKEPAPKRFSPLRGGSIFSGKLGNLPVDIGLWKSEDILAADARFKPEDGTADFDLVRIRF